MSGNDEDLARDLVAPSLFNLPYQHVETYAKARVELMSSWGPAGNGGSAMRVRSTIKVRPQVVHGQRKKEAGRNACRNSKGRSRFLRALPGKVAREEIHPGVKG